MSPKNYVRYPKSSWTTLEAAALSGVSYPVITSWVARRLLIPKFRGRKGAGGSHRFSLLQVVGLIVAGVLIRSRRGCSARHACDVVREFATSNLALDNSGRQLAAVVNHWLGLEDGDAVYHILREKLAKITAPLQVSGII